MVLRSGVWAAIRHAPLYHSYTDTRRRMHSDVRELLNFCQETMSTTEAETAASAR